MTQIISDVVTAGFEDATGNGLRGALEMGSVEQHETPSPALTFSSSANMFDTFKSSATEARDSDEESFHLPMLDSDDDNKEALPMETEDEILNRFDTGSPDVDQKCEDSVLNDKEVGDQKETIDMDQKCADSILNEKEVDNRKEKVDMDQKCEDSILDDKEVDDKKEKVDMDQKCEDSILEDKEVDDKKEKVDMDQKCEDSILNDKEVEDQKEEVDIDQKCEDSILNGKEEVEDEKEKVAVPCSEKESESSKNNLVNIATSNVNNTTLGEVDNSKMDVDVSEKIDENSMKVNEPESDCTEKSKEDGDLPNSVEDDSKSVEKDVANDAEEITETIEQSTSNQATDKTDETTHEAEIGKTDEGSSSPETKEDINSEVMEVTEPASCGLEDDKSNEEAMEVDDTEFSDDKVMNPDNETDCNETVQEKEVPSDINKSEQNVKEVLKSDETKTHSVESEKEASTSTDAKDDSLECEDLLNISVIRDVDEDNAAAIAEHNNDLIDSSEKSDNEEQDEDKAETEVDVSEMGQDDNVNSSDKDMEFEEDENSSNFCDQETTTNDESTNDGTANKEFDNDSNSASKDVEESITSVSKSDDAATSDTVPEAEAGPEKEPEKEIDAKEKHDDKTSEAASQNKRPLEEVAEENASKKIRLSEKLPPAQMVKALASFRDFMQSKKIKDRLTRSDLEQFVLQKICEVVMHKHEMGDMLQTMKKQEETIETLRKDMQQLMKQSRDLDIVNKKLMNELKTQNSYKKPLVPLKITRSVGLQVKLNFANEANPPRIRKTVQVVQNSPSTPRTSAQNNQAQNTPAQNTPAQNTPAQRNRTNANTTPVRPVPSPRKTPQASQQQGTTPILSQALQVNRQATPATKPLIKKNIVRSKPAESAKPANSGVIDLTDEDDKSAKVAKPPIGYKVITKSVPQSSQKNVTLTQSKQVAGKNQTKTVSAAQVKSVTKSGTPVRTVTSLPQSVRLTPTQVKNGIAIPTTVMTSNGGSTPQLMYVVQPSSMVTSGANGNQKTLLLNFQPTNGVLTSTLNGSAVSVISKPGNSLLKTIAPKKHPAPLPIPPPTPNNSSLKPLLPKPVLSIRKTDTGIILQWRMPYNLDLFEGIASYQLFAYQESTAIPTTEMWRKVGDVKALALPMACTLTQFVDKNKYYFAVRSVDVHKRLGAFSDPEEISL